MALSDSKKQNLTGVEFFEINEVSIVEYHPLANGQGEPTEAHMNIDIKGFSHPVIMRMKSGKVMDELIVAMITHRRRVFG